MHHRRGLRRLLAETGTSESDADALADALQSDWRTANLDERLTVVMTYAEKLTREPGAMRQDDLSPLRAAGLTDEDILAVCLVVSYYAFANRLADGLGLAIEP